MMRRAVLALALATLGAAPADAFDCKRAASASEKAICADPVALAADGDLDKAFEALRAGADPKTRPQLVAAQLAWLKRRDGNCSDQKGPALAACLTTETRARVAFLNGTPDAGPGAPGRLAPVFRMQKGGKGRADIDIQVLKFVDAATPAARAFNAAVDKLSTDIEEPDKDDPAADRYAYAWSMRLVYASPRLVSAHADGYADTGGAHPNSFTANINIDMAAGREATFDSLLDKAAAQKVFALCLKQVKDERREREGQDETDADVLETIAKGVTEASGDLKVWGFGADAATLTYDPYVAGAYAEGAFDCVIPYSTLRPLAKPGFPLP
ncbi:MAG: DUF1311 domain-containing protein [Hyphomicrobiales bacterium]|nr:DUF1311 domain-containing protein [Hyphomicrobiales bacterium]